MTNLSYLFAAYAVVWVAVFLYLFGISRKRARLEQELKELKQLLAKGGISSGREQLDLPGAKPH